MSTSIASKIGIVLKVIKALKNWYTYVAVYCHLIHRESVILETRSGVKIKIRVDSTDLMAFTHVWILHEYDQLGFEIKNDDIVIDIGSHIGLFALYAARFCKNGKIYCFEPVKENFEALVANLKLNGITNVLATNAAVSSAVGTVTIYLNDDESGHSMYVIGSKKIEIASISLKNIMDSDNIEKCDFLKIDCEGEEYEIINSLPSEYFDRVEKMVIEYHFADTKPHLLDNLIKKLKDHSFGTDVRVLFPSIGFLYAQKMPKTS